MKGKRSQSNLMLSLDPNLPNNSLGITVMKELNYSFGHTLGVLVEVPFTINVSDLGQSGMNQIVYGQDYNDTLSMFTHGQQETESV